MTDVLIAPDRQSAGRRPRAMDAEIRARPWAVQLAGIRRGRFDDLRDAISSAGIVKREHPLSRVAVEDLSSGQLVIEIELS